jgi:LuxR family maltose regulon positive regulatory protein
MSGATEADDADGASSGLPATAQAAMAARDPILMSKIVVPGTPGWVVPRPRLDRLIAEGTRGPVTTVVGPPGAGKTMALALWAAASRGARPIAWVTVDDYDNQPGAFWSYVLAALRQAGAAFPRSLSATASRYPIDHTFLLRLAAAMATLDPPVTLVLDDVHLLTAAEVSAGLAYILKHARPGLHLVVSSRMDPLLPLHRYRLAGEITEIRASDLAFTVSESRQLLDQHGIRLSDEWLGRLNQRAEGWAAIMRMAAISMGGHCDPEQFARELVTEDAAVTGYLVEEVLNAQPAHVRDFLLTTSILEKVSEGIANELSGSERGAAVLVDLARVNPLIQRDDSGWYHYHSLFAEVLRLKLRRENPGRVADLHLRAAGWYSRHGAHADAVRHAADAGDWEFASRAVVDEFAVNRLLEPRANEPLVAGFRQMPADRDWAGPHPLLVAAALHLAWNQQDDGAAALAAAERMLGSLPATEDIPARFAAALCRLALSRRTGDFEEALAAAESERALVAAIGEDRLPRDHEIRAHVLADSGTVKLWSGDLAEAAAVFKAATDAAGTPGGQDERSDCLGYLALVEALRGSLSRAAELAADATAAPAGNGSRPASPASRAAEVALAFVSLERYDLPRARLWLTKAHDGLRMRPDKLLGAMACYVAARESLAHGRGQAALEMLGRAEDGWSPPSWLERRLMVMGLLAAGDPGAARKALAAISPGERTPDGVAARLAAAQASYAASDPADGRRALEHALRLAEPEQVRLPFVMERGWIWPVLQHDPELAQRYRRLLEPGVISPGWAQAHRPHGDQDASLIIEPLSDREREVLRYVSAMESNAEIATEMYISVNTVKTHLKSIYRKLAATHRGEAVRRARQLGML